MSLTRRSLLASACATAACMGPGPISALSEHAPVVDVHTHMFNASDLSVAKFVSVVVCKNYTEEFTDPDCRVGYKRYGKALGEFVRGVANQFAPNARTELKKLTGTADAGAPTDEDRKYDLADDPNRQGELDEAFIESVVNYMNAGPSPSGDVPGSSHQAFINAIEDEAAGPGQSGDTGRSDREKVRDIMAEGTRGEFGNYLKWARNLCRSRNRIIETYKSTYAETMNVTNFVSLLVDYELWLDEPPASNFDHQMKVMAALRQNHPGMLNFAPFDPLRQAFAMQDGDACTPLDDLKRRWNGESEKCPCDPDAPIIMPNACVPRRHIDGVKIYPPMGFRPYDNAEIPDSAFPVHVVARWNQKPNRTRSLGAQLDAALHEFYTWAQTDQVPILTHSGNSVDAGCKFAERGAPLQWRKVLDGNARLSNGQLGPGFRNLRLCLGHFDEPAKFDPTSEHYDPQSWGHLKGGLLDEFDNVYADLSYIEEIVDPNLDSSVSAFFRALRTYAGEDGGRRGKKILFGSDWIMFDREANKKMYFSRIQRGFREASFPPGAIEDFASENAKRYLQLS
jgi:hypothetical protein